MKLIADSGSTKTAWCLVETPENVIYTQGINPFQQNEDEICSILQNELLPSLSVPDQIDVIHFYGAGCTPEKAPVLTHALRQVISNTATIHVESDMLGAARSVCQHQSGIVCILGTGSNSCYYDGRSLHPGIPALGYILGDEGSGAYIGKRLVSDILKKQLPEDIQSLFFEETHENQANIIQRVYRTPLPNRYLASLSPFCARHREHPAIHAFLLDCFEQFFRHNIIPQTSNHPPINPPLSTVHFVGSIAHYYRAELSEAATRCGYTIGTILQSPLEGLIAYHQNA
jgi:N-acetylglucosamine kinase-like BadF-type ATPase